MNNRNKKVNQVDRKQGVSSFQTHSEQAFENWLKEYTVGDLWEKNVLTAGGDP